MFGYVIPDKPNMFMKDYTCYKAHYCGLCKAIGKNCGQMMRFTTGYDMTFLLILAYGITEKEPEYKQQPCILSPLKKKLYVTKTELTDKIIDINTLLIYYKLLDDKHDDKSLAKETIRKLIVSGKYKKAKKNYPQLDVFYNNQYAQLRELEKNKCDSVDRLADCFSNMLKQTSIVFFDEKYSEELGNLMYNIGRWIYFSDAIDDIEKDFNKKNFNPFLVNYNFESVDKFFSDKKEDLEFLLMGAYNNICKSFGKLDIKINEGVLTNILWYGILNKTNDILGRNNKCKKTRI